MRLRARESMRPRLRRMQRLRLPRWEGWCRRPGCNGPRSSLPLPILPTHLAMLARALPTQVNCWACSVLIQVPLVGEAQMPAPFFKCGWCGATCEFYARLQPQRSSSLFKRFMRVLASMGWLIVAVVTLLVLRWAVATVFCSACRRWQPGASAWPAVGSRVEQRSYAPAPAHARL